jgi:hypothetical protein
MKKGESAVLYQGECDQAVQPCDLGTQKPNAWGMKKIALPEGAAYRISTRCSRKSPPNSGPSAGQPD